jgi:integral membrane protein
MARGSVFGVTEVKVRPSYAGALLRYRVMAYITGVALVTATILLILQKVADVKGIGTLTGLAWLIHGWCFLLYAAAALHLAIKLRWPLRRLALVVVAGVVPLLTFFIERYVMRTVRERESAASGS